MLLVFWLSLWLGLYLLSRRPRSAVTVLTGLAYVALSTYVLSTAVLAAPERVPHDMIWGGYLSVAPFAPALLLHAFLRLTGTRLPHHRAVLACFYACAAAVYLLGLSPTLLYRYTPALSGATSNVNGSNAPGPLYLLQVAQVTGTLALALAVLLRARREERRRGRSSPAQLSVLTVGCALTLVALVVIFVNVYVGSLRVESLLQPILIISAALMAVALAGYPGLVEGQLLRTELRASLLGSLALLAVFTILVLLSNGGLRVLLGVGWLILTLFLLRDDIWTLLDRLFYGAAGRSGRESLRAAATYSGSGRELDLDALSPGQAGEAVGYLTGLERAGLAAARLEGSSDPRLELLARDEFAVVRQALGLPSDWAPAVGVERVALHARVQEQLEPRERQALALKYLGYADKEMAELMGVRHGVPRSYLSAGKRKLGLPAGASLQLFVHFAGLVGSDALPLLREQLGEDEPETVSVRAVLPSPE
jgi:hypothetical protein